MKTLKPLLLSLLLAASLASCKKSDDTAEAPLIDPSDSKTVASQVAVRNATVVAGMPPAPSTSASAPVISTYDGGETFSAAGFTMLLRADITSGTAAGVYAAIKGSDSYFKIPALSNRSGRRGFAAMPTRQLRGARVQGTQSDDDVQIAIKLPENIKPGTFCVAYCVYDAQNRVSNVIERCIEVRQLGSTDPLIAGTWTATKGEETEDSETVTYLVGQQSCTRETADYCTPKVTYDNCETLNKLVMNLATNGAFNYEYAVTERYPVSVCATPIQYKTENYTEANDGGWTYDPATEKFILIINFDDSEAEEAFPIELAVFKLTANEFVWGLEEDGYKFQYYMKK